MNIQSNISLRPYNTFGIDVPAKYFAAIHTLEELKECIQTHRHLPMLILGGGSNVLFTKPYEGLVLNIQLKGKEIERQEGNTAYVKAAAGEQWHEFVLWTMEQQLGGIENMSLIPGNIGAAPMQNIGAYGVELKDCFFSLEALNIATLNIETFDNAACHFGYRESVFKNIYKGKYIILSVTLALSKTPQIKTSYGAIQDELNAMGIKHPTIKDVSNAVINIRQSKLPDPKVLGNSGSFFKNPVINKTQFESFHALHPNAPFYEADEAYKIPAGWLIEQCGWKGKRVGNTGSHASQALVLVNFGNATGAEIWALALEIKKSVADKFGIDIDTEVNIY